MKNIIRKIGLTLLIWFEWIFLLSLAMGIVFGGIAGITYLAMEYPNLLVYIGIIIIGLFVLGLTLKLAWDSASSQLEKKDKLQHRWKNIESWELDEKKGLIILKAPCDGKICRLDVIPDAEVSCGTKLGTITINKKISNYDIDTIDDFITINAPCRGMIEYMAINVNDKIKKGESIIGIYNLDATF